MSDFFITNEAWIRSSIFFGLLSLMALVEYIRPARSVVIPKIKRWSNNVSLAIFNGFVLRLVFPVTAFGVAEFAQKNDFGLFSILKLPFFFEVIVCIVILDFIIYWQHRFFHKIPVLWPLHATHHCDTEVDASTGARFHTIEILLSFLIKLLAVIALGAPALAVILFEIILNGMAVFNHSNISLPKVVDRKLRNIIVTPDMHRIHHSIKSRELNSNFGFNLSVWDRLFNSYTNKAEGKLVLGLANHQNSKHTVWIFDLMTYPFKRK